MLTHIRQTYWIPQEYMHHRYFSLQELITQVLYMSATKILKLHLRCICLFTCAAIRALHLELVKDQTTQAFLRAFR